MTVKFFVGLTFFPEVGFYRRTNYFYFINRKTGDWVAMPAHFMKILIEEYGKLSPSENFLKVFEILAKNNILRDSRLNQKRPPLETKPLLVKIQTTGKCNLNCTYCFNNSAIRTQTMSHETMTAAVDYALSNPCALKNGIQFIIYGGEPLTERELFFDTVNYIREKNSAAYIGIITNATLLTDEDVEFFKSRNVQIIISFDGLPIFQASNRFGEENVLRAEKILEKIKRLKDFGCMERSCILCTVTKNMSSRLSDIVLFLQEQGICNLEFLPLRMLGTAEGQSQISADTGAFVSSLKKIVDAIEDGRIKNIRVRNVLRLLLPLETGQTMKGAIGCHRCSAGRNSIAINYDGSIIGCDMIPEKFSPIIGDVWGGITNLEKLDALIEPVASEACKKCLWFRFCRGGCVGASASDNDSINTRHKLTCATNKELYPYLLEKLTTDGGKLHEYFVRSSTKNF